MLSLAAWAGIGLGSLFNHASGNEPTRKPAYQFVRREGYSRTVREACYGVCVERLVEYGDKPGLEYEDFDGIYTATFLSEDVRGQTQRLLYKLPHAKRRKILADIDADRDGEITEKEVRDYDGD
jgi:hypothetical protein